MQIRSAEGVFSRYALLRSQTAAAGLGKETAKSLAETASGKDSSKARNIAFIWFRRFCRSRCTFGKIIFGVLSAGGGRCGREPLDSAGFLTYLWTSARSQLASKKDEIA